MFKSSKSSVLNILSPIYAITPNQPPNILKIQEVIKKYNITILQYRRKINDLNLKYKEALLLKELCQQLKVELIINDDINLARQLNLGVHLGKNDMNINSARKFLGTSAIIGVSCYNDIKLAKLAEQNGASYCGFGSMFLSATKPYAPSCSLDILSQAKQQLTIPIVAIGGIDFDNCARVFAAGVDSCAMITALWKL